MPAIGFRHTVESKLKISQSRKRLFKFPENFWRKVNKDGPVHPVHGVCWIWTASRFASGLRYGQARMNGRGQVAHRVSWSLVRGDIPDGSLVLHKCDNPICVNPDHLFLGDYKDNTRDMWEKGRAAHLMGEEHGSSVLTEKQVKEMRGLHSEKKWGYKRLAKIYNVCPMTIARVIRRETWKHI